MSPLHLSFAILFSAWIFMVIIRQIWLKKPPKLLHYLTMNGFSFLCPVYSLFAPNPVFYDMHILYRVLPEDEGQDLPDFKELSVANERTVLGALWNPALRVQKLIVSSVRDISRMHVDMKQQGREEELKELVKFYPSWGIIRTAVVQAIRETYPLTPEESVQIAFIRSQYYEKDLSVKPYMVHTFKLNS